LSAAHTQQERREEDTDLNASKYHEAVCAAFFRSAREPKPLIAPSGSIQGGYTAVQATRRPDSLNNALDSVLTAT